MFKHYCRKRINKTKKLIQIFKEQFFSDDCKIDQKIEMRCNKANPIFGQLLYINTTTTSKLIHSQPVLSVSNMVHLKYAEAKAIYSTNTIFNKSRWSDQKRPN
jgi:hypothetical protein